MVAEGLAATACHWRLTVAAAGLLPRALADRSDVRSMRDYRGQLHRLLERAFVLSRAVWVEQMAEGRSSAKFSHPIAGVRDTVY